MTEAPPRGTVYGTLLNHRDALAALGAAVHQPPYKAPPRAPVLYIKPRNTWVGEGGAVVVPAGVPGLEMGATVGLVIGRSACRVSVAQALSHVAGCVIVNDVSVPHESLYRPALRFKARDTFCPIGPFVPLRDLPDLATLQLRVALDGEVVYEGHFGALVRSAEELLADVSDFMTLQAGDVLCLGVGAGAPRARAGQGVAISVSGLGTLSHRVVAEADAGVPA